MEEREDEVYLKKDLLLPLKTNGMKHTCAPCVHREYCQQNREQLIEGARKSGYYYDKETVPIPDTCPLANPNRIEQVIFS